MDMGFEHRTCLRRYGIDLRREAARAIVIYGTLFIVTFLAAIGACYVHPALLEPIQATDPR